jgi:aminoglycoside phosphotransferase (APT) family kinase protein
MHGDQLDIDLDVVRLLIAEQFPRWRDLPVVPLAGYGTVNAIYRIGDELSARFPLQGTDPAVVEAQLRNEALALAELAACSPFAAPLPVALGHGGNGYPLPWSVHTWVPGEVATPHGLSESPAFTGDLVALIRAMRGADVRGRRFAGDGRGGALHDGDEWMARCLRESAGIVDVTRVGALWTELRELPDAETQVMSHRDLIPANLLVHNGRLVGVLDGGGFGPADPALDLVAGWHLLDAAQRATLRAAIGCGPTQWRRSAGWALLQSMGLVWYYPKTNPMMAALGRSTIDRLLGDDDLRR